MVNITENQVISIGNVLNDPTKPLKQRFRALFTLRNIGGATSINCIEKAFSDSSALLKHELAYCLGQMQDASANPVLKHVLENVEQEPMVRHEAAEALGAIGSIDSIEILEKYKNDPVIEVAETCQLAIERIRWSTGDRPVDESSKNPYKSVDPAPPAPVQSTQQLRATLLDGNESLFNRYRAMFSLRNQRTTESVLALADGLKCGSALFRHEVAFVLGQLQDEESVPFLIESLENRDENEMVRHECAEALGAIANRDCMAALNKYLTDDKRVVKESCEIALDMCEYENSPEFQYANALNC